ncbi:protein 5NUC-like [Phlebotomus argentipes]|uniref:protein 5NUC-like n=1 Tax=Phlebotomus argentipes TaxID=94469 RepID=UPI0028934337|nr:protein 5NUC-like [Phlebotomus argentipes]
MFLAKPLLLLSLVGLVRLAPFQEGNYELIILHNNDMHARFDQTNAQSNACRQQEELDSKCYGGFARVATIVRKYRADNNNVLFLNAGDTYTGTPWFTLYNNVISSEMMNILHPDAISLGNHEFDNGVDGLVPFLNSVEFPVLAANLDLSQEPTMAAAASLKPSTVFTVAGHRIGVIGYLTPDTKFLSAANKVEYIPEITAINQEAQKLRSDGVEVIIALGHSGLTQDREIARNCPDVDIVIGGHSHTFLYAGDHPDIDVPEDVYPVVVTQASGKQVPVVQAYAYTKYLGYLKIMLNATGSIVDWDGQPILLDSSVPQDTDVLAALQKYRAGVEEYGSRVVGVSRVVLDGASRSCRFHECNMGNLITDAFVHANVVSHPNSHTAWTDASIGLYQGGGIRAPIDPTAAEGNITRLELDNVLPFGNTLYVVPVPGSALKEALEHSVHRYANDTGYGEFLQMSGIQVVFDLDQESGSRVESAQVLCNECIVPKYEPLDNSRTYNVIMTNFMKDGGDGYAMFKSLPIAKTLPAGDINSVDTYIERMSPIFPAVEWRITVKGSSASLASISGVLLLVMLVIQVLSR